MNHFLWGASIPFLVGAILYALRRGRASLLLLILMPLTMVFMGTWAVAPDIPRMLGFHAFYNQLAQDPRINLFLWHYSIDQLETSPAWYAFLERESSWFAAGIVFEATALMGVALRELFRESK